MGTRHLVLIAYLAVGAAGGGCGRFPEPESSGLTAEQAKAAMVDLLRSTDLDSMRGFPLDRFAGKPPESHPDGSASWADLRFDLKGRKYAYTVERGGPGTKGHFAAEYEGGFKVRGGKWVATKPRVKWIT